MATTSFSTTHGSTRTGAKLRSTLQISLYPTASSWTWRSLAGTDCVPRSSSESAKDNDLGHTNRPPAQSRPGIHPAQDHHQSRLPFPSRPVSRPETQGHQPVEPLQLPESGLLCLAARVLARTSRHPDRGDADRPVRAQAL